MNLPLSISLREGTKASHRMAEQSPFMRKLFEGHLTQEVYGEFLVQLFIIYHALEDSQYHHFNHSVLGKVHFPSLFRSEALKQDLDFYFGGSSWKEYHPTPATEAYVQRIRSLAMDWVDGLVAHHYTRYLGDLSGGQVLKRIIARTFNLPSDEGLAFYNFPEITNIPHFKDEYRMALDSLPVDEESVQKIVDEANLAFCLNRAVFDSMISLFAFSE